MKTQEQIDQAKREIEAEDEADLKQRQSPEYQATSDEIRRRCDLPSEHPDHVHSLMCDGQDGWNSYCCRLRRKLGY